MVCSGAHPASARPQLLDRAPSAPNIGPGGLALPALPPPSSADRRALASCAAMAARPPPTQLQRAFAELRKDHRLIVAEDCACCGTCEWLPAVFRPCGASLQFGRKHCCR